MLSQPRLAGWLAALHEQGLRVMRKLFTFLLVQGRTKITLMIAYT